MQSYSIPTLRQSLLLMGKGQYPWYARRTQMNMNHSAPLKRRRALRLWLSTLKQSAFSCQQQRLNLQGEQPHPRGRQSRERLVCWLSKGNKRWRTICQNSRQLFELGIGG